MPCISLATENTWSNILGNEIELSLSAGVMRIEQQGLVFEAMFFDVLSVEFRSLPGGVDTPF